MRNALVVADGGGSAALIPYFELFGTFPASVLLTWGLSRLMRVFSFRFTFSVTLFFFLGFFIVFAHWIYPHKDAIPWSHWPDLVFYIMAELWKVALLSVIFWGFLHQKLDLSEAKRFYPPLLLGTSVGTILAGPITVFCTSVFSWNFFHLSDLRWQNALYMLTLCLCICGILTHVAFGALFKKLQPKQVAEKVDTPSYRLSLFSSIKYLTHSPYLRSLFLIVIAEYVCYTLGELIFLEALKIEYPTPAEYCGYMGNLSFWMGILTAISAVFITPYLLQAYSWSKTVLLTPLLMVIATFLFFFFLCIVQWGIFPGGAVLVIALGSIHFCIGRASKYTLFDAIKELAFIPLNQEGQVKGKLIIDGIGSRLGRGTSSGLSLVLFFFMGGPIESVFFAGILAVSFAIMMIPAAKIVGNQLEQSNAMLKQ